MKRGAKVLITRGGDRALPGTPGCLRQVKGTFLKEQEHRVEVRLEEDDPLDTVGWTKAGVVGWWCPSQVKKYTKERVLLIRTIGREQMKKEVEQYYRERGEYMYPSDVADALQLNSLTVFEITLELEDEGLLE